MKKVLLFFATAVFLTTASLTHAATQGDVVINEIAWMGGATSANDEWMELKNTSGQSVDLSGWTLTSADQTIKINLKGTILAGGFYLLERTDNNSVPNITADLIYKGGLNNAGQDLILYDASKNIINEVNNTTGWPAGNNTTKQTMEKTASGWQTSKDAGGTPKAENSSGVVVVPPMPKIAKVTTTKTTKPKATALPKAPKTDNTYLAAVSDPLKPTVSADAQAQDNAPNPWILFLSALAIIIILTGVVLFLKLKFKKVT